MFILSNFKRLVSKFSQHRRRPSLKLYNIKRFERFNLKLCFEYLKKWFCFEFLMLPWLRLVIKLVFFLQENVKKRAKYKQLFSNIFAEMFILIRQLDILNAFFPFRLIILFYLHILFSGWFTPPKEDG